MKFMLLVKPKAMGPSMFRFLGELYRGSWGTFSVTGDRLQLNLFPHPSLHLLY